jgi:hypothetical protein
MSESSKRIVLTRREALLLSATAGISLVAESDEQNRRKPQRSKIGSDRCSRYQSAQAFCARDTK